MSGLITSGDTTENFGKLLPAVYIERIYINDHSYRGAQLNVDLNIFIRAGENTDITTLISQMGDLQITWFYTASALIGSDVEDLMSNKQDFSAFYKEVTTEITDLFENNTKTFSLSTLASDIDDYLITYDDEGNRILKYTFSSSDDGDEMTIPSVDTGSGTALAADTWDDVNSDIYLFAFASFDSAATTAAGFWYAYDGDYDDRFGRFAAIETGDVAWESVWIDGEPSHPEQVIWVDGDGNAYDGTPLQSLASKYYSTDVITHSEIVSSFEDLLGNYETAAESDDSLRDIMDQISLVLATHKGSAGLLAQLNLIARVFPSKSSVTNVGALYIQYREKITTANAVIETGTEVFKEVITNTKVVDERGTAISYEEPGTTLYGDETFDTSGEFISNMKMSRLVSVEQVYISIERTWDWDNVDYNNYGFVFFDYDKALYETADMGYYLHMDSLINLLGKTTFNAYFKIYKARFYRYYDYEGDDQYQIMSLATSYGSGYKPSGTVHFNRAKSNGSSRDASQPYIQAEYDNSDDSCAVHSFLMLRNLESLGVDPGTGVTLGTMASEEHRLMCFEFQDLYTPELVSDAGRSDVVTSVNLYDDTTMWFEVQMRDYTAHFVYYLINAYKDLYDGGAFEDYYDEATTSSNYNSEDDMWTSEYVNTLLATYEDDPGSAPWVLYPVYYCVFEDLASKKYDSDLDTVMAAATKISARIHPTYGTVSDLKSFFEKFEALYDDTLYDIVFDSSGDSYIAMGDYTTKKYQDAFALDDLLEAAIIPVESDETDDGYEITSICDTAAYASDTGLGSEVDLEPYTTADVYELLGWELQPGIGYTYPFYILFQDYGSDSSEGTLYIDGEEIETDDDVSKYFKLGQIVDGFFEENAGWTGGGTCSEDPSWSVTITDSGFYVYLDMTDVNDSTSGWCGLGLGDEYVIKADFDGSWSVDPAGAFPAADFSFSFTITDDETATTYTGS